MAREKKGERLPQIKQLPSGSWTAKIFMYKDENGKDHYQSVTDSDPDRVVARLAALRADRREAKRIPADERMTVGDCIDRYIESKAAVLSPATVRGYKTIRANCLQSIMRLTVSELTQEAIQRAVSADAVHLSPKTVRNAYGLLRASMAVYAPDKKISARMPQKEPAQVRAPSEDDVEKMLDAARGTEMEIPIMLGAFCGMRRSEIAGLRWSDIDIKTGVIRIRRAEVLGADGKFHEKAPKTITSARDILAPQIVIDALSSARESSTTDRVTSLDAGSISWKFRTIIKHAGVEHYRFHDLRHYLVSVMIAQGVPIRYISEYVGHSTETTTARIYTHIMASKKFDVDRSIKEYFDTMKKQKQNQEK